MEIPHFVMERKMLLGIKRRAGAVPHGGGPPGGAGRGRSGGGACLRCSAPPSGRPRWPSWAVAIVDDAFVDPRQRSGAIPGPGRPLVSGLVPLGVVVLLIAVAPADAEGAPRLARDLHGRAGDHGRGHRRRSATSSSTGSPATTSPRCSAGSPASSSSLLGVATLWRTRRAAAARRAPRRARDRRSRSLASVS